MKKQILNLGKALDKVEQKQVNGGNKWEGHCFPSEGKCNFYCSTTCSPCGATSSFGYTPHTCGESLPQ
jgi:hypothetical protein